MWKTPQWPRRPTKSWVYDGAGPSREPPSSKKMRSIDVAAYCFARRGSIPMSYGFAVSCATYTVALRPMRACIVASCRSHGSFCDGAIIGHQKKVPHSPSSASPSFSTPRHTTRSPRARIFAQYSASISTTSTSTPASLTHAAMSPLRVPISQKSLPRARGMRKSETESGERTGYVSTGGTVQRDGPTLYGLTAAAQSVGGLVREAAVVWVVRCAAGVGPGVPAAHFVETATRGDALQHGDGHRGAVLRSRRRDLFAISCDSPPSGNSRAHSRDNCALTAASSVSACRNLWCT